MPTETAKGILESKHEEFDIHLNEHVVAVVTDGASVMTKMGKLCKPIHQICFAHAIHLAICDVLYDPKTNYSVEILGNSPAELNEELHDHMLHDDDEICDPHDIESILPILKHHLNLLINTVRIIASITIYEHEWEMLDDIHKCLKPVEIAVASLCSRDSNLLTAEGIFNFMYPQIDNIGSQLALDVFQTLKERINDRRVIEIVAIMKYLLNPESIDNSIKKSDLLKTAKVILKCLYPIQAETNDIIEANTTQINNTTELSYLNLVPSKSIMLDELRESIHKSTTTTTTKILEDDFHFLAKEFSHFEATGS
ncbi:hypothetical protein LOD99_8608 [Oopsacas minuta]|uniref:Uncharacterized protein n=1 Tax=Oopsacas minuta TaxID=111878 RepID=A0AAV7JFS8_9METZ|nr:hypothetical protein LOD99_8608 [Oopsacas minuta]